MKVLSRVSGSPWVKGLMETLKLLEFGSNLHSCCHNQSSDVLGETASRKPDAGELRPQTTHMAHEGNHSAIYKVGPHNVLNYWN